ncbi:hypothetical protein NPIL_259421 [Nephila pilipes]|uniref:Uncharacterized protein n=1 Tax=Nephila pilipes TaxID=299642 RepID=A0A8X6QX71_NEPPI|nr:hypothetical protein NPIL_259421 [Nephila pilipes]
MEANLTSENLKYYPFKGYSLYVLPKFRQVAGGILIGVIKELTADFCIIKVMETDCDKSGVVSMNVWKSGVVSMNVWKSGVLKILGIYSPPCNSPDFSYVNHCKYTIFVGNFNAHSLMRGYYDTSEAEGRV